MVGDIGNIGDTITLPGGIDWASITAGSQRLEELGAPLSQPQFPGPPLSWDQSLRSWVIDNRKGFEIVAVALIAFLVLKRR